MSAMDRMNLLEEIASWAKTWDLNRSAWAAGNMLEKIEEYETKFGILKIHDQGLPRNRKQTGRVKKIVI